MKKLLEILGLLILLCGAVFLAKELAAQTAPQKPPAQTESAQSVADLRTLVAREFGDKYVMAADIAPVFGDFDGDGTQDLAVVATGDNPLMGEGSHGYKTLDPYNASFGYGNPKVTMSFNTSDKAARYILIMHSWQSPAKKFVLVNVPFVQLRVGHMMRKKKSVDAIEAVDEAGVQAAIFFDGKKYRWEIIGSEVDK